MDERTLKTIFSSKTDTWATPQPFYDKLNKTYTFTLDPCASAKTAKCTSYFTEEDNGLDKDWSGHSVFMNPPYGRGIGEWLRKAHEEGQKDNTSVVCLIPSRTDTKYFHNYCMRSDLLYFVKGRLKFGDSKNSAPFPSMVVVFDGTNNGMPLVGTMGAI